MKTILVIDDDRFVREAIQDLLEISGFQTLVASTGKTGLDLALQHHPDLILCDVQMPEMNGYEVLTALRQHPKLQAIPFIFLTAQSERPSIRQGMNLGADDYLSKPCSSDELINALNSRLEKQKVLQSQTQQKLDQLRSSIAMSLPHEFRTPLTGILTSVELLRLIAEDSSIAVEVLEVADTIQISANRLHQLIQRYLLYTKLEVGRYAPTYEQSLVSAEALSDPAPVIESIAVEIARRENRDADLHLDLHNAAIAVSWFNFEKILAELVDNAFKFSLPETPINVMSSIEDNHFKIQLSNKGRGLTAEQIASLGGYTQFQREIYEQQGVGLGLAIAQRLIQLHQGTLTIHSIPDQLTTVSIVLPLAE